MSNTIRKVAQIFIGLSLVLFISTLAVSQDFPKKPITVIVPFGLGSGADTHARRLEPYLEKHLGVSITVENKAAASGKVAMEELWNAAPDGYTVIFQALPGPIYNQVLFPVKYNFREFTFLYSWSGENTVLVVNSEVFKTTDEFISAARARSLSGGTSGVKSGSHIRGLMLEEAAKLKPVRWVHYTGGSEPMAALAGKHVDFVNTTPSSAVPLIKAGKCIPLLVYSNNKDFFFPNATLPKEVGLDMDLGFAYALRCALGPPRMPAQIADIWEKAFIKSVQEPGWREWAEKAQIEINPMNREQLTNYVINCEKEILKHKDKFLK